MFLEAAHALSQRYGLFGFIVPPGNCTDKGSASLRDLFLEKFRWEWPFGFESRDTLFDIDSRFKFCPVTVRKGCTTAAIRATFMRRKLLYWEDGEKHAIPNPRECVEQLSPNSKATFALMLGTLNEDLLEVCRDQGVAVYDPAPNVPHIELYLYDSMHMTEAGAAPMGSLVGSFMAEYLFGRVIADTG